jgi:succinate dehydrogenase / fumarate reductase membrane anchor subunit
LSGLRAWLVQRVSALYIAAFLLIFVPGIFMHRGSWDYTSWRALVLSLPVSVAVLLLFVALLTHAWVGVRDVVLDYVHPFAPRFALLGLFAIAEIGIGAWVLAILLLPR